MMKFFSLYKALQWMNNTRHAMSSKVQPDNNGNNDQTQIINTRSDPITINVTPSTGEGDEEEEQSIRSVRRRKTTKEKPSLRIEKVISGVKGIETKKLDEIKSEIKIQTKSLMKFLGAFILYAVLGGLIFFYVEECSDFGNAEDNSIPQIGDRYIEPTYKNLTLTCLELFMSATNKTSAEVMGGGRFDTFLSVCRILVKEAGNPYVQEGHKQKCVWDPFQLLKYAEYTIFTLLTIGYGNTTPITTCGRCLAIIYSIVGVPIAVSMYSIAGKLLSEIFTFSIKSFNKKVMKKNYKPNIVKLQVLAMSIFSVIVLIMIGCSITTRSYMENWNFSSSVYFWFISLTTIGYGDLHFDRDKHLQNIHLLLISASLLLFGLGMVAAVIESFALVMEKKSIDDDDDSDDDGSYIDFNDHERVKSLVMSTVVSGAGVLMESLDCNVENSEHDEDDSTTTQETSLHPSPNISAPLERTFDNRKKKMSFMGQTINLHRKRKDLSTHQHSKEEDLTELDEMIV